MDHLPECGTRHHSGKAAIPTHDIDTQKGIETLFDVIEPYEVLVTGERKLIDEWYTIDEITEKYGLLRHRIRKIINAEGIPTKKAGTRTLIAKNKIDTYFKKKGFDTTLSNLADW